MIISDLSYLEVVAEVSSVVGGTGKYKSKKVKSTTTTVVASPVQVNNADIKLVAKPQIVLVGDYLDIGDINANVEQKVDLEQTNNNSVTVKP